MNRKPFMRWGRFYNNSSDRIVRRLWNFILTRFAQAKHRFLSKKKQQQISDSFIAEWMMVPTIVHSSVKPVITWIGHATFLVQIGGINILTDPVFFEVSRFFKRKVHPTIPIDQLPKIDVIIISHNHRDHLDLPSLSLLKKDKPRILVPFGNKQWFQRHGFDAVDEMEWGQTMTLRSDISFTFLPAYHWTSRGLFDINTTLWGSWLIQCDAIKIYFAGDSAYDNHFAAIGKAFGPIDIALMPVGPNEPRHLMSEAHIGIDEALRAFGELNARHFIPMHWGTFKSGLDSFSFSVEHLKESWQRIYGQSNVCYLHIMKFGQSKTFEV